MIRELFYELHSTLRSVAGDGAVFVLFVLCALFLASVNFTSGKRSWACLLSPLSLIAATVSSVIQKAYATADKCAAKIMAAVFAGLIAVLAITSSGKNVFSRELCEKAENDMHVPGYIMTAMNEVADEGAEEIRVLAPDRWTAYFEGYSGRFIPVYDDDSLSDEDRRILDAELESIHPDMKKIASIAHGSGCGYVVLPDSMWPDIPITKLGYEVMAECGGCTVYREVREAL